MKLIKKSFSFITAIVCCAAISSIMPFSSSAEESVKTYGDLSYFTSDSDGDGTDDYVKIIDCNESVSEVEIPAEIEGLPVKKIETSTFYDRPNLTDINVAENNNYYSSSAGLLFDKNKTELIKYPAGKSLKNFNIPNGVKSLDGYSFCNCSNLTSINIPESVTYIGIGAFYLCTNLKSIAIPDSVTKIENITFTGCSSLTSISIPESVTYIGLDAFKDCTSLTSIYIPDSVTLTGLSGTFSGCTSLTNVKLPDVIYIISTNTFAGCSSLLNIIIPDSVTSIKECAFEGCKSLTNIAIPESVTKIKTWAFKDCTSLKSIAINNPDCEISNAKDTIPETAVIYGYKNSTAQTYAESFNRKFISLEEIGDISGNGEIDLYDAIEIAKAIMGLRTFTAEEMIIADFNKDGTVDLYDAIEIARTLLPK